MSQSVFPVNKHVIENCPLRLYIFPTVNKISVLIYNENHVSARTVQTKRDNKTTAEPLDSPRSEARSNKTFRAQNGENTKSDCLKITRLAAQRGASHL